MKKHIGFLILAVSILVQSCKKDDTTIFTDSPNARVTASLTAYQKILTDATTGWKGMLYPSGDTTKAYMFYFKFDNNNRVVMLSTFTDSFARVPRESSYRLKALQTPALLFDTYSYLHVLSDPNPTSSGNGGAVGGGLYSDFEFAFDAETTKSDSITLIGRQNNSILKLTKLSTAQAAAVASTGLIFSNLFPNIDKYLNYFRRVTINNVIYEIVASIANRTITFNWVDASGVYKTVTVGYYYSFNGVIEFNSPLVLNGVTITSITDITWDPTNVIMTFKINGNVSTVTGVGQPVKVDLTAPSRWFNDALGAVTYWRSTNGFHENGVDDAYGVKTIVNGTSKYSQYIYYPQGYTNPLDRFVVLLASPTGALAYNSYGVAINTPPTYTPDGRIVFVKFSNQGTVPVGGAVDKSHTLLFSTTGFYLVQTGAKTYDMVSSTDGKAWISWYRP